MRLQVVVHSLEVHSAKGKQANVGSIFSKRRQEKTKNKHSVSALSDTFKADAWVTPSSGNLAGPIFSSSEYHLQPLLLPTQLDSNYVGGGLSGMYGWGEALACCVGYCSPCTVVVYVSVHVHCVFRLISLSLSPR